MSWFDKLKALFNLEINSPLVSVIITRNSGNISRDKEYVYDKEKDEIKIFHDNLSQEKKYKLEPIMKESFIEDNKFLETKANSLLKDLYAYQKSKDEDKRILEFFHPIIPKEDFEVLEASLYFFVIPRCLQRG